MSAARWIARWTVVAMAVATSWGGPALGQTCPSGYPYYCANSGGYCCPSGYPYCTSSGQCSANSSGCGTGDLYCSNNGGYCCDSSYPYCTSDGNCSAVPCDTGYGYCSNNGGYCCAASTPYCTSNGGCSASPPGSGGGSVYFSGVYSYSADFTAGTGSMHVDQVVNTTSYTTGTLRLELWATSSRYAGGTISGYRTLTYVLGQLPSNYSFSNVNTGTLTMPGGLPAGTYYLTFALTEYDPSTCAGSNGGYCIVNYGNFTDPVTVSQATDDGGDDYGGGGGGAFGALALLALLSGAAWRRVHSRRVRR